MQLDVEIEKSKRLVRTDAYQMSVGEIVNMYKDGELIINPDFQRLFRWGAESKIKTNGVNFIGYSAAANICI